MCTFLAYVAFNKATNIYIIKLKQKKEKKKKLNVTGFFMDQTHSRFAYRTSLLHSTHCAWHSKVFSPFVFYFYTRLSVCRFVNNLNLKATYAETLFCLVDIKKRSFLTSCVLIQIKSNHTFCVFWFVFCANPTFCVFWFVFWDNATFCVFWFVFSPLCLGLISTSDTGNLHSFLVL